MINVGSGNERDNPARSRLINEERLWRENFEARIWNAINEMRHQIENNWRKVSEQWEVMQDIKVQHNEIMVMIENLQTAIYNSGLLKEMTSEPRYGTPEKQTPDSGKWVIVIMDESRKEEIKDKQSTVMQTLKAKKSRPYSFLKSKITRIFEQALKSGLTLPACKRPTDIDKASEGEFCPYHRILGHTIEECWIFNDLIEKGYKDGTIQLPKSFQQDSAPHNSNNKGKGLPIQSRTLLYLTNPKLRDKNQSKKSTAPTQS
jgi:hypothetical protein